VLRGFGFDLDGLGGGLLEWIGCLFFFLGLVCEV